MITGKELVKQLIETKKVKNKVKDIDIFKDVITEEYEFR